MSALIQPIETMNEWQLLQVWASNIGAVYGQSDTEVLLLRAIARKLTGHQ